MVSQHNRATCFSLVSRAFMRVGPLVVMALLLAVPADGADADSAEQSEAQYWQEVYQGKRILEIELKFTGEAWREMQPAAGQERGGGFPVRGENEFTYSHAAIEIDGHQLDKVGVRFKGNSSYRSSQHGLKRPFKIDTNRFVKGLKWRGRTKLNLSNSFKDASYLREKLGYEVFQAAGLPVPGVGWAHLNLTIEGEVKQEDLGLYVLIEQVDDNWIERKLGSESANSVLMKPEGLAQWPYLGEDLQAYERYGIKEGEKNRRLMKRFADFLRLLNESDRGEFSRQVEQYLDLENWAQYFAANTLLVNLDSMVAMTHNYYLLVDSADGLIKILPWDLNECFGLFTVGASPEDLVRWDIRRPWVMESKLLSLLFDQPEFRDRYDRAIRKLLESAFRPETIGRRVAELQPRLERVLKESQHANAIRFMRESIDQAESRGQAFRGSTIGLKYFMQQRVASVNSQLAGTAEGVRLQQRRRGGGPPLGPPPGIQLVEALDVNRDGVLSSEEIKMAAQRLKTLDRNGDGKLSQQEYERGGRPDGNRPPFPPRPR